MISYLICCSAGTQILPIVIIRYVVRSNFFERNPEDESGLVNFEVGVCVKSIAVDQVQCSCDCAAALAVGILEYGHSKCAVLDGLTAVSCCIDTDDREIDGPASLCAGFDCAKSHGVVVADDAVEFLGSVCKDVAHLVQSLGTVIQAALCIGLGCVDAVVSQCLENRFGTKSCGSLAFNTSEQDVLDVGLAGFLEVVSKEVALELTGGMLVGSDIDSVLVQDGSVIRNTVASCVTRLTPSSPAAFFAPASRELRNSSR